MKLETTLNASILENATLIAESNEFAIYDVGNDTYMLVHRHESVEYVSIPFSRRTRTAFAMPGSRSLTPRRRRSLSGDSPRSRSSSRCRFCGAYEAG